MELVIEETYWWGWNNPGKKVVEYKYDLDGLKKGEKVVVSTTKVMKADSVEYVDKPNLYFILEEKRDNAVELKIGSWLALSTEKNRRFDREDIVKEPLTFLIEEGAPLILTQNSTDAGYSYSIALKK